MSYPPSVNESRTLIYAPPHYVGNLGDRIVTERIIRDFPHATFIYDNFINYYFVKQIKKIYLPRGSSKRYPEDILKNFDKVIIIGMDAIDGFYDLKESRNKIALATLFATNNKLAFIINLSWNNNPKASELEYEVKKASDVGVRFFTRDSISENRLRNLGVNAKTIPDLAFSYLQCIENAEELDSNRHFVILSPCHTVSQTKSQVKYFTEIAVRVNEMGFTPIIFLSVRHILKGDYWIAKKIQRNYKKIAKNKPLPLISKIDGMQIYLNNALLTFTARMHIGILSMSRGVPAHFFEYQGKTSGMQKDWGLENHVRSSFEIEINQIAKLLNNSEIARKQISEKKQIMIETIENFVEDIKKSEI